MKLFYFPDVDQLDAQFLPRGEKPPAIFDAGSPDVQALYDGNRLVALSFAHATETAPWPIQVAREALAARAKATGQRILYAEINEEGEVAGAVVTEEGGPFSEDHGDRAIAKWNRMVKSEEHKAGEIRQTHD